MLAPLQQAEAIEIRRKSDTFGERVEAFRRFFQQKAPFAVPGGVLKLEHVSFSMHVASCHCVTVQFLYICLAAESSSAVRSAQMQLCNSAYMSV